MDLYSPGVGTLTLNGTVTGTDAISGAYGGAERGHESLADDTSQGPAGRDVLQAQPSSLGTGAPITVLMTVQNQGQATAVNVTGVSAALMGVTLTGTGTAGTVNVPVGPLPAAVASLGGGLSTVFTYVYAKTAGTLQFTGNATGYDINTGFGLGQRGQHQQRGADLRRRRAVRVVEPERAGGTVSWAAFSVVMNGSSSIGQGTASNVVASVLTAFGLVTRPVAAAGLLR